jgi:predicted MFS family arabinose efflux permease
MDRAVTSVILQPIKLEFGLTDGQTGALGGLTHGIAFCLAVLPLGWLSDRINRRNLLITLLALWSAITFIAGFAQNFVTLLAVRFFVGGAEAGASPLSMSLISDVFPPRQRATAIGILYLGLAVGQGLIFLIGGQIAQHHGWRAVYMFAGIPGLILAVILFFTTHESQRGASDADRTSASPAVSPGDVMKHISSSPAVLMLIVGATAAATATNAIWAWMATLLIRKHQLEIHEAGLVLALAAGVFSGVGSSIAGPLSELFSKGRRERLGNVAAVTTIIALPLGYLAIFAHSTNICIGATLTLGLTLGAWLSPTFSLLLDLTPSNMRGSVMSSIQLTVNFFAIGIAPFLVGLISDWIGGTNSLAPAMASVFTAIDCCHCLPGRRPLQQQEANRGFFEVRYPRSVGAITNAAALRLINPASKSMRAWISCPLTDLSSFFYIVAEITSLCRFG